MSKARGDTGFGKAVATAKPAVKKPSSSAKRPIPAASAPKKKMPAAKADAAGSSRSPPPAAHPPATASTAESGPAVDFAPAPPPPQVGEVHIRYNHYCKPFEVVDGVLAWSKIDEDYCISFVFKGGFVPHLLPEQAGSGRVPKLVDGAPAILPDGGALRREVDAEGEPCMVGTFSGVQLVDEAGAPRTYQLFVDEDAEAEEAARGGAPPSGYRAAETAALGPNRASAALTAELKNLSVDELRDGSDRYKALLEARDLEDCLYGSG